MVWVGRNLIKDHLVASPCCGQGHLLREQVSPSPIQLALNTATTSYFKHDIIFES